MKNHLYELLWHVETDSLSFLYRELKTFISDQEARKYGEERETELNQGLSAEECAQDGYYFKFQSSCRIREIDGCEIEVSCSRHPGR